MGAMQDNLKRLIGAHNCKCRPALDGLDTRLDRILMRICRGFGGIQEDFPSGVRGYDLCLGEGVHVELDEYLHFNRYREWTLRDPGYASLEWFPLREYLKYCHAHETECLRVGKAPLGNGRTIRARRSLGGRMTLVRWTTPRVTEASDLEDLRDGSSEPSTTPSEIWCPAHIGRGFELLGWPSGTLSPSTAYTRAWKPSSQNHHRLHRSNPF